MARVLLIQPWKYRDEGVRHHDLGHEWRNGPYSLILLGTQLKAKGQQVRVMDLERALVAKRGSVCACLNGLVRMIEKFAPDVIGLGFFSVHYCEAKRIAETVRQTCRRMGLKPLFVAGGIHATTEPHVTLKDLDCDCVFIGEAEAGIVRLAAGEDPHHVPGVLFPGASEGSRGEEIRPLDSLPFPDWSLSDYRFYAHRSTGKLGFKKSGSLDMMMGRGCAYKCNFCAYPAMSSVRFCQAGSDECG